MGYVYCPGYTDADGVAVRCAMRTMLPDDGSYERCPECEDAVAHPKKSAAKKKDEKQAEKQDEPAASPFVVPEESVVRKD